MLSQMTLQAEFEAFLSGFPRNPQDPRVLSGIADDIEEHYPTLGQVLGEEIHEFFRTPFSTQRIVCGLAEEVEKAYRSSGVSIDFYYYAGEFYTGDVNACAVKVDGGFLFLLNTGLIDCIHKFSCAHIFSDALVRQADGKGHFHVDDDERIQGYSFNWLAGYFADLAIKYLNFQGFDNIYKLERPQDERLYVCRHIINVHMWIFIIMHEFAHAVLGHLAVPHVANVATPVGLLPLLSKSHKQEHEADLMATRVLLSMGCDGQVMTPEETALADLKMASIANFFFLADLLGSVSNAMQGAKGDENPQGDEGSTHPDPLLRLQFIIDALSVQYGEPCTEFYPRIATTTAWFNLIKPRIMAHLQGSL